MTLPQLYGWSAQRSGPAITITHSTGKITGVVSIQPKEYRPAGLPPRIRIVAVRDDGAQFELGVAA